MEELIAKLRELLAGEFRGAEIELEPAPPAQKVAGFLVWSGFQGMEQLKRQDRLWRVLKKGLSKNEQLQITAILTVTPEEWAVSKEA
jgi:acid stress-induced BolA-like protein IbaG/YrbA